jgi:hypothetical protein
VEISDSKKRGKKNEREALLKGTSNMNSALNTVLKIYSNSQIKQMRRRKLCNTP